MKDVVEAEKIYSTIQCQMHNQMLSHAYLIETVNFHNMENVIKKIAKILLCSKQGEHDEGTGCGICHLIDTNQCFDFKMIYPDGNFIKKEQLLEIKKLFKTTTTSPYRIYVIFQADKLNSASANTILKFLEEPEQGIVAFLVADNRYQVLDTLVSRCQILTMTRTSVGEISDKTIEFFRIITKNADFYLDFKELFEQFFSDKEEAKILIQNLEELCHQLLLNKLMPSKYGFLPKDDFAIISKDSIIKYIIILEEEKQKLYYNVNYRLWFSHLLIRFREVLK